MNMKEMMERAQGAKSPEELLALAKEQGFELTAEEAEETFALLHKKGELAEEELENVAGGGCDVDVGGHDYTVVTAGLGCFTGQFESNWIYKPDGIQIVKEGPVYTNDKQLLRKEWERFSSDKECGRCRWLSFKGGVGYCSKS